MNFNRAKEILDSPETITVVYNGSPIWIEDLDPKKQTALVSSETLTNGMITVPVENLQEDS